MSLDPAPASPPAPVGLPDPGVNWRPRYWSIFAGQALSLIGSAMTQFVLIWWITDTTASVSALATAGLAALLPYALLGPLGGAIADRHSRRWIMVGADLVSAACMVVLIVLFLTGRIEVWHAYGMMFIRSAAQAFQSPAASASAAMLVPAAFLPRAAGLNQTLQGIMTVAAAPLGAMAISVLPIGWALSIDVFTAVLGITPLLVFAIPQAPRDGPRPSLWREFIQGVKLVWSDAGLRNLYGVIAAVTLVVMPSFTLVALLIKTHFGGGAPQVALMESLTGAAMIAAGLVVAALAPRRPILWFALGFAISCFALAATAAAPRELFWVAVLAWSVSGFAYIAGSAPLTALLQTIVPNQIQGRVLSLLTTVMGLAAPVGLAIAAPLGAVIGIRALFIAMGIAGGVIALLALRSKSIIALGART